VLPLSQTGTRIPGGQEYVAGLSHHSTKLSTSGGSQRDGQPLLDVQNCRISLLTQGIIFQRKVDVQLSMGFVLRQTRERSMVGESGCGKSTTGRAILLQADRRQRDFNGVTLLDNTEMRKMRCHSPDDLPGPVYKTFQSENNDGRQHHSELMVITNSCRKASTQRVQELPRRRSAQLSFRQLLSLTSSAVSASESVSRGCRRRNYRS